MCKGLHYVVWVLSIDKCVFSHPLLPLLHLCHLHLSFFATGLSSSQPNHPGPGDPDRALSACDCPTPRGGGLPVLPQCLSSALLPLQGPPGPIRDTGHQRLFPPEGLHTKYHEVWTRLWFCYLDCITTHFPQRLHYTFNRRIMFLRTFKGCI